MKVLLIIILSIALWCSCLTNNKPPLSIDWSNKDYVFIVNQTNRLQVITGLREDGVLVWKLKSDDPTYEPKYIK